MLVQSACPRAVAVKSPTTMAPRTGGNRCATGLARETAKNPANVTSDRAGASFTARTIPSPKGRRTPATIAIVIGIGSRSVGAYLLTGDLVAALGFSGLVQRAM